MYGKDLGTLRRELRDDAYAYPHVIESSGHKPGQATLRINLQPYVEAFEAQKTGLAESDESYLTLWQGLSHLTKELYGQNLYGRMLAQALTPSDDSVQKTIQTSPASVFWGLNFTEILKNSIGAVIMRYYSEGGSSPLELCLDLDIDIESVFDPDGSVKITLSDNGPGFPAETLSSLSEERRRDYLSGTHSIKRSIEGLPKLFGGADRGMGLLLAMVDNASQVDELGVLQPLYKKPELSQITFSNGGQYGGAVIAIQTSVAPLRRFSPFAAYSEEKTSALPVRPLMPPPLLIGAVKLPPRTAALRQRPFIPPPPSPTSTMDSDSPRAMGRPSSYASAGHASPYRKKIADLKEPDASPSERKEAGDEGVTVVDGSGSPKR
jgi:hypothetical protein